MPGIAHPSTCKVYLLIYLSYSLFQRSDSQDWPRHRRECTPVNATQQTIATPPPVQPQLITVSAILFAPEEGLWTPDSMHIPERSAKSRSQNVLA